MRKPVWIVALLLFSLVLPFNACERGDSSSINTSRGTEAGNPLTQLLFAPFVEPPEPWQLAFCIYEADLVDENGIVTTVDLGATPKFVQYSGTDFGFHAIEKRPYVEIHMKIANKCGIGSSFVYIRNNIYLTSVGTQSLYFRGQTDDVFRALEMNIQEFATTMDTVQTMDEFRNAVTNFLGSFEPIR